MTEATSRYSVRARAIAAPPATPRRETAAPGVLALDITGPSPQSKNMPEFAPRNSLTIDVRYLGESREPVLIIDDFLSEPETLVAAAQASEGWRAVPPGGYPGRRAPLPGAYVRALLRRLDGPIRQRLLRSDLKLQRFDCSFSLVTAPPTALAPLQRIPHIDIADEHRIAVLHYLCDDRFGGTAFFRQLSTGLEQITPAAKPAYLEARAREVAALDDAARYPGPDTPGYVQTGAVDVKFNRLVAYRSLTLHSGIIDNPARLSDDPGRGRLTANFFVDYAPAK